MKLFFSQSHSAKTRQGDCFNRNHKKKKKNETNSGAKEYNEIKRGKGRIGSISSKLDQAEKSVHSKHLRLSREEKR